MAHRLPHELLEELRTYLLHFDQTEHIGERSTVDEIRRRLKERIAKVEAEIERNSQSPRPPMSDAPCKAPQLRTPRCPAEAA